MTRNLLLTLLLAAPILTAWGESTPIDKTVWATYISWGSLGDFHVGGVFPDPVSLDAGPDKVACYRTEIETAKRYGINGFLFDLTSDPKKTDRFIRLYTYDMQLKAAEGIEFYINPMFDGIKGTPEEVATALTGFYRKYAPHSNVRKHDGKILIFGYHMNRWKPEFWREVFALCRKQGAQFEAYFEFRTSRTPDRRDAGACAKLAESVEEYAKLPDVAGIYFFYELDEPELLAETFRRICGKYGKKWGSSLQVGYSGAQRSWRSDWYHPFYGSGVLRRSGEILLREKPDFVHMTTWNDYQETELRPTLFQQDSELRITEAYLRRWRGEPAPASADPDVVVSAKREILAGEVLRIEYVNLPVSDGKEAELALTLFNLDDGKPVAAGGAKTIDAAVPAAGEWLIDTAGFAAKSPVYPTGVIPEVTVTANGKKSVRRLPAVLLRHGRADNTITAMTPLAAAPPDRAFSLETEVAGPRLLKCAIDFDSPRKVKHLQLLFDDEIFHSIDADDFDPEMIKLTLKGERTPKSTNWSSLAVTLGSGAKFGRFSRRFTHNDSAFPPDPAFSGSGADIKLFLPHETALELIGKPETKAEFQFGKFKGSATLGELRTPGTRCELRDESGDIGLILFNSARDPFPAWRPELGRNRGKLALTLPTPDVIRGGSTLGVSIVYEDGSAELLGPYFLRRDKTATQTVPLLAAGESFDEALRHFTVNRPARARGVRPVRVYEYALQSDRFDFTNLADPAQTRFENSGSNGMCAVSGGGSWRSSTPKYGPELKREDGKTFLRFDGIDDYVVCGNRTLFSGSATVELRLRPLSFGKKQVLWCNGRERNGYRNMLISLDSDGFLRVERDEPTRLLPPEKQSKWLQSEFETKTLKSTRPLALNAWNDVAVVYDFNTMTIFLDGKKASSMKCVPYFIRGNSSVRIGAMTNGGEALSEKAPGVFPFHGDIAHCEYSGWPKGRE